MKVYDQESEVLTAPARRATDHLEVPEISVFLPVFNEEPNLRLLHTDLAGNVLQTLSPALGPATLMRGLGFDNGAMFIAGRDLPGMTNRVYEIDRTSGAVIRSFTLPGNVAPAALTGGTVIIPVPEPGSIILMMTGLTGLFRRRRR